MEDDTFDPIPYLRLVQVPVGTAIALAGQLVTAAPSPATPPVNRAMRRLRKRAAELNAEWTTRDEASRTTSVRPLDLRNDRLWGAAYRRLDAFDGVAAADVPEAARAVAIRDALFPRGLAFLSTDFPSQWAEGNKILQRIDADPALASEIERLVGASVMASLRESHRAYGEALGIVPGAREAAAPATNLARPLRALTDAIVAYALQLAAMRQDDPKTADAVARALAPLDEYRARGGRGAGNASGNGGEEKGGGGGDNPPAGPAPAPAPEPTR